MKNLIILFVGLSIFGCIKDSPNNTLNAELAKLPPITQEGANTFGCLVNGKAVLPNCSLPNCPPPLYAEYDNDPNGHFSIECNYDTGNKTVLFGLDSIKTYKKYLINDTLNKKVRVAFLNYTNSTLCERIGSRREFKFISGEINLSRVDIPNGIFSGTFNFIISTQNCGTVEITNGRFDYKF